MNQTIRTRVISAAVIAVFLVFAAVGFFASKGVSVNYDLADYLSEDTETYKALEVFKTEFGMAGTMQVMVVGRCDTAAIKKELASVSGVLYISEKEKPNEDKHLFTLLIDGDDNSDTAKAVEREVKALFSEKELTVEYGGSVIKTAAIQKNTQNEMTLIVGVVIVLATVLLLLSASSWLDPLLLLAVSGVAILINMGLNLFLGEISFITNAIAAILQLALSVDYSIVLLHTYRDMRMTEPEPAAAMKKTVKTVFLPILASALTTVAGLAALLFMTFTIGIDLGLVLIKGIAVSALASLSLLPAAALLLDKPLLKTKKPTLVPKGAVFCRITEKASHVVLPVAAAVIVAAAVLQAFNTYTFTDPTGENKQIAEEFGRESTVVLLYKNGEDRESDLKKEQELEGLLRGYLKTGAKPVLLSAVSLSSTAEAEYTPEALAATLGIEKEDARLLFTMYRLYGDKSLFTLTPAELLSASPLVFSSLGDSEEAQSLAEALTKARQAGDFAAKPHTPEEFQASFSALSEESELSLSQANYIYGLYGRRVLNTSTAPTRIFGRDLVSFLIDESRTNLILKQKIGDAERKQLRDMLRIDAFLTDQKTYDFEAMGARLTAFAPTLESISLGAMDADSASELASGVYILYANLTNAIEAKPVKASALVSFLVKEENNALLAWKLDATMRAAVSDAAAEIEKAYALLVGEDYTRILITLDLPNESGEPTANVKRLIRDARSVFGSDVYFAGELVSTYDLEAAFTVDNLIITLFTVTAVFLIIMLVFRSLSLPVLLVAVIQGAIFLALATSFFESNGIFFLSYIVTTCILMGATIDYGILMSSSYVAMRKSMPREEALRGAVKTAMPTVFASGITLAVCGAAIAIISSQPSISSVGLLIAKGALASILLITLVLPSILYRLDGFVLRLTFRKQKKDEQ